MTDTITKTIEQFISDARISMTAARVDRNSHMEDSDRMDHWKCTLVRIVAASSKKVYRAKMTTYFSMGYGHGGREPQTREVLDCLTSDASSVEWDSFEDWADNLGYDRDSRKAERIYKTIERETVKLKKFLGANLFDELNQNVARL
jgi:hypothetical protein